MKKQIQGYWIPVLHAHLPFVKHPEHDYFLEENWLFEAITESYIPLLINMKKMTDEAIDFRLTMSLSPPLLEMFADLQLMEKYQKYLDRLISLSQKEMVRLKKDRRFLHLARFYNRKHKLIKSFFSDFLKFNVLHGFSLFFERGNIELITSSATHGLLPLLSNHPESVEAQISVAVNSFQKHLGKSPDGIWLPECAYYEGLDKLLSTYHIKFFFLDSHGIMNGRPVPRYGLYAPIFTSNGIAVFGRDPLSSRQVWSAAEGYPGDFYYRDFYRDAGFDLDFNYIRPFINPDGIRVFTGIKYYRITGNTDQKEIYEPDIAFKKTVDHAAHFHAERVKQVELLRTAMDRPPAIISPYDAELFGHWWFEGPDFLYQVFLEVNNHDIIKSITPSEYLLRHPLNQIVSPSPTSWGNEGYYDAWLNTENDWMYRHIHHMADTMVNLANSYYGEIDKTKIRILNQMLRELLLAQSSDWAFLITTNSARAYSVQRLKEHISNFQTLHDILSSNNVDMKILKKLEGKNSIFKDLDFRIYANKKMRDLFF